jgi:hypothetical protein
MLPYLRRSAVTCLIVVLSAIALGGFDRPAAADPAQSAPVTTPDVAVPAGKYSNVTVIVDWNLKPVASGSYQIQLKINGAVVGTPVDYAGYRTAVVFAVPTTTDISSVSAVFKAKQPDGSLKEVAMKQQSVVSSVQSPVVVRLIYDDPVQSTGGGYTTPIGFTVTLTR